MDYDPTLGAEMLRLGTKDTAEEALRLAKEALARLDAMEATLAAVPRVPPAEAERQYFWVRDPRDGPDGRPFIAMHHPLVHGWTFCGNMKHWPFEAFTVVAGPVAEPG